ncbi:MAG: hypothetical protein ABFS35_02640 [Bacteroidota bacterium]
METITDIDVVISKISNNVMEPISQSSFLNKPMFNQPNSKSKMETLENNIMDIATARSYEMNSGILSESYSILNESDNSAEVLSDTDNKSVNDIIIILSDDVKSDELTCIYNKFKDRLKLIIHYGNNNAVKRIFNNFSEIISVNTLKNAVNKSYLLVQNGQTILFPRIETNFDFFKHVTFS